MSFLYFKKVQWQEKLKQFKFLIPPYNSTKRSRFDSSFCLYHNVVMDNDALLKRILIDEDHFTLGELKKFTPIEKNSIYLFNHSILVVSIEFRVQVYFNPHNKIVIVMKYGETASGDGYENDYIPYYSYGAK